MRKHWIDNLRWVTVLLVLAYHVVYFFNNKGVPGGFGGFGDGPQYQDALMYVLYPWFMPLLFILAGISARYALQRKPAFLSSPVNNIYGWFMCLAMMGWFKARFDKTGPFAAYMTRSSYGIYILHYLVVASLGTLLRQHTDLSPALIYVLMFIGVFCITPIFYEIVRRIPFLRWCSLGEANVTH